MKRLVREPSQQTRDKMSKAHQGMTKNEKTRQKISDSMRKYWAQIPSINNDNQKSQDYENNKI